MIASGYIINDKGEKIKTDMYGNPMKDKYGKYILLNEEPFFGEDEFKDVDELLGPLSDKQTEDKKNAVDERDDAEYQKTDENKLKQSEEIDVDYVKQKILELVERQKNDGENNHYNLDLVAEKVLNDFIVKNKHLGITIRDRNKEIALDFLKKYAKEIYVHNFNEFYFIRAMHMVKLIFLQSRFKKIKNYNEIIKNAVIDLNPEVKPFIEESSISADKIKMRCQKKLLKNLLLYINNNLYGLFDY